MGEMSQSDEDGHLIDADRTWQYLLEIANAAKAGDALVSGALYPGIPILAAPHAERSWRPSPGARFTTEAEAMLDLYMPLCVGASANDMVVAHLGQSLDGRIATSAGVSQFITGEENLIHTHRMRALFDAVVVGANTAKHDNPKLTTRLASGEHATRVLIDPSCSANERASIFVDGVSDTIVICETSNVPERPAVPHLGLESQNGMFAPSEILSALKEHGLRRIFIEGGGITVSEFLGAGALDRLQICVAPMIIGSGRPAIALPEVAALSESHYLDVRHFASGNDLLFDCQLRGKQ